MVALPIINVMRTRKENRGIQNFVRRPADGDGKWIALLPHPRASTDLAISLLLL